MVHYIAQKALFSNALPGSVLNEVVGVITFHDLMPVRIHHILPCCKANQQYPRKKNMIFTRSQISNELFYNSEQK